jgi:competence protein ComEC
MLDGQRLRVTFLDVGQGDASVLELPDGQTILIDGGAAYDVLDMGRTAIGPYLWNRGIRRLDHVIGTHPQLDHVGGLAWAVRKFDVGRYWGNGIAREEPFYRRLQEAMQERGLVEHRAEAGHAIVSSGPCRLQVFNPPVATPSGLQPGIAAFRPVLSGGSALNNFSVVTRLDCGPHSFLFTADVEIEALSRLRTQSDDGRVRVLKVPHHGSRSSLDEAWIQHVKPETAVISVGRRNSYGHPANAVLEAYEQARVRLFRTIQKIRRLLKE